MIDNKNIGEPNAELLAAMLAQQPSWRLLNLQRAST
jgi:hypothetical protein